MELDKYLKDDLLIITSSENKEEVILNLSKKEIVNYKIISMSELKEELLYTYDIDAVLFLMKNYNLKVEVAKEYLNAMQYVENVTYRSNKLNMLQQIKDELTKQGLLKKDLLFPRLIDNKDIIVYGIDFLCKEDKILLSKLNMPYIIVNEMNKPSIVKLYNFETLKEEINYLAYSISALLKNNVPYEKIKIANIDSSYEFLLDKYFKMYNLHVKKISKDSLYYLPSIRSFLTNLKESNDLNKEVESFIKSNKDDTINSLLIKATNKFIDKDNYIDALVYELKKTSLPDIKYEDEIECISLFNYIYKEDEYIFVVGVNQGHLPRIYKNEDFLDNSEKEELGIDTTEDKNILEKQKFALLFNKNAHFYFSYKRKSSFANFEKSFILNDFSDLKDEEFTYDDRVSYSSKQDKLELACAYDKLYKKEENERLALLNNTYSIPYKAYSNKFVRFDREKIRKYLTDKKINLSYSALDNYYKCGFKYYLNNVLKLSKFEGNSATEIGNLFHETLQHCEDDNFDFDSFYESKYGELTEISTLFYAKKLKEKLRKIIEINKENKAYTQFNQSLKEKKIEVMYDHPITIKFKGFIDKLMYMIEDDKTYVAIIDYKTGYTTIDLNKVEFGLSLQLPIYLYLLKHTEEFKNVVVAGFYLQKLLDDSNSEKDDEDVALADSIKYQGYSNSSPEILSRFDSTYQASRVIKSMRVKNDGTFYSYCKVISSEEMEHIAEQVENKIQEAIDKICNCEFDINPKVVDNDANVSCAYCEFKDCCFKTFEDRVYYKTKKDEEGENNGNEMD